MAKKLSVEGLTALHNKCVELIKAKPDITTVELLEKALQVNVHDTIVDLRDRIGDTLRTSTPPQILNTLETMIRVHTKREARGKKDEPTKDDNNGEQGGSAGPGGDDGSRLQAWAPPR